MEREPERLRGAYLQEYVSRPALLPFPKGSGNLVKFDLRLYAALTDIEPTPQIWLHEQGFARLSTLPYDDKDLQNLARHITNLHYQRNQPGFSVPHSSRDDACSHSIRPTQCALEEFAEAIMAEKGAEDIWNDILRAVGAFIFGLTEGIRNPVCHGCYQVWGVDLVLDESATPYVIEVNASPSIERSIPLADGNLLFDIYRDLWELKGVIPPGKQKKKTHRWHKIYHHRLP